MRALHATSASRRPCIEGWAAFMAENTSCSNGSKGLQVYLINMLSFGLSFEHLAVSTAHCTQLQGNLVDRYRGHRSMCGRGPFATCRSTL